MILILRKRMARDADAKKEARYVMLITHWREAAFIVDGAVDYFA